MPKYFKSVTTNIDTLTYKKYLDFCKENETTPHQNLKGHIEACLGDKECNVGTNKGRLEEVERGNGTETPKDGDGEEGTGLPY